MPPPSPVQSQINSLRDKLLDLSNKNRLLNFQHGARGAKQLRVIDVSLTGAFASLLEGEEIPIRPLPPLAEEPSDENTREFKQRVAASRLTNEDYLKDVVKIEALPDSEASNAILRAERRLKDQIRRELGLPDRKTLPVSNLQDHMRSCNISPGFDLHTSNEEAPAFWQTSILPEEFERRTRGIEKQSSESRNEEGIETLYAAFCFIEWFEKTPGGWGTTPLFAPLLLFPIELKARNTPLGLSCRINSREMLPLTNVCFEQRAKRDFNTVLPQFNSQEPDLTNFLKSVSKTIAHLPNWKLRTFLTISHFRFHRIAMWKDLEADQSTVDGRPIEEWAPVKALFSNGVPAHSGSREEPVDESAVPVLIRDCDSSQFSAVKDILSGQHIVVQGPPGTGKSQTIANAIAALMWQGKSVLFVAEKAEALNVVYRRLSQNSLASFCLPLHSLKDGKKGVLEHIKKRLAQTASGRRPGGELATRRMQIKETLDGYAAALSEPCGSAGYTFHELVWHEHLLRHCPIPNRALEESTKNCHRWTLPQLDARVEALRIWSESVVKLRESNPSGENPWIWVNCSTIGRIDADEIVGGIRETAELCRRIVPLGADIRRDLGRSSLREIGVTMASLATLCFPSKISALAWNVVGKNSFEATAREFCGLVSERAAIAASPAYCAIAPAKFNSERLARAASKLDVCKQSFSSSADLDAYLKASFSEFERLSITRAKVDDLVTSLDLPAISDSLDSILTFVRLGASCPEHLATHSHAMMEHRSLRFAKELLLTLTKTKALAEAAQSLLRVRLEHLDPEQIASLRHELHNFSWWSPLSPRYWKNKSKLNAVLVTRSGVERTRHLDEILECVRQKRELSQSATASVIGDYWKGVETDAVQLGESVSWIEQALLTTASAGTHTTYLRQKLGHIDSDQRATCLLAVAEGWDSEISAAISGLAGAPGGFREVLDQRFLQLSELQEVLQIVRSEGYNGSIDQQSISRTLEAWRRCEDVDSAVSRQCLTLGIDASCAADLCKELSTLAPYAAEVRKIGANDGLTSLLLSGSEEVFATVRNLALVAIRLVGESETQILRVCRLSDADDSIRIRWLSQPVGSVIDECEKLCNAAPSLLAHASFLAHSKCLSELGLECFCIENIEYPAVLQSPEMLRALYFRKLCKAAFTRHRALDQFRHSSPDEHRERFARLDRQLGQLDEQRLRFKLLEAEVPAGITSPRTVERTERALLEKVCNQERPRMTLRDILARAGHALKALHPCFLMSPLSVAQLIQKDRFCFDVVIFDEASQVRPEDSLSSVVRGKQIVIVGDRMQLPPSRYGERDNTVLSNEDSDGEELDEAAELVSLIEMAESAGLPQQMLKWHYRSKVPALISYSNQAFYDSLLQLLPSSDPDSEASCIQYVWVGGPYSSSTNPEEAAAVVTAALSHMAKYPDRSLGIVALNRPQAELIEIELARRGHGNRAAEEYNQKWGEHPESLLIKNLESVQGDERDVIFISTVYGANAEGVFHQRFGPINSKYGHRRLNVIFTRAKYQIVVFTSLPTEKIVVGPSTNWGVRALKEYLEAARAGKLVCGASTGRDADSPFEVAVIQALRARGWECEAQVGVSGYFIDIGVRESASHRRFLAGIECDGAAYHSALWARDRDRLRQEVLESLGWSILRIWSTDWFRDPEMELERLIQRLEALKANASELPETYAVASSRPRTPTAANELSSEKGYLDTVRHSEELVASPTPDSVRSLTSVVLGLLPESEKISTWRVLSAVRAALEDEHYPEERVSRVLDELEESGQLRKIGFSFVARA